MVRSTLPSRIRLTASNAVVALALLMLIAAACGGATGDPVAEIGKIAPLEPGRGLLVFVYTDG